MRAVAEEVLDLVREYGGVNSSEHGDGLARSEFNREIFGDGSTRRCARSSGLFDPDNRMNPGKIVDAPAMTEQPPRPALGHGRSRSRRGFAFEVTGGMRAAADRCMNIGLCRKSGRGVMCPSYMATRERSTPPGARQRAGRRPCRRPDPRPRSATSDCTRSSTSAWSARRARASARSGWTWPSLKTETLSHYHDLHGVPLRSGPSARSGALNRLGSATAPLSNLPGRSRAVRRAMDRLLGIDAAGRCRPSPATTWCAGSAGACPGCARAPRARSPSSPTPSPRSPSRTSARPRSSCWSGLAGGFGWRPAAAADGPACPRACSTRPRTTPASSSCSLHDSTEPGSPIVGCEPSCLMTLRDEYLALLPGDPAVTDIAGRVRQVEELLLEAIDAGRLRLREDSWLAGRRLLYHGHCHQKAEVGTAATVALLSRIPGVEVEELDAGCCGMAGSFGFESEHYDVSMKVGSDRLFPAIAAEPESTVVVATGVSCRQQIFHGTKRDAWHPVQLVREALTPASSRQS